MKQVLYVSVAAPSLDRAGIAGILEASRRNNARVGVTGLLCLLNGSFLQILEGPVEAVDETYARIAVDRRHGSMLVLLERDITERDFPDWKMGFRDPDPACGMAADAFELTTRAFEDALPEGGASRLLFAARSFYRINAPGA